MAVPVASTPICSSVATQPPCAFRRVTTSRVSRASWAGSAARNDIDRVRDAPGASTRTSISGQSFSATPAGHGSTGRRSAPTETWAVRSSAPGGISTVTRPLPATTRPPAAPTRPLPRRGGIGATWIRAVARSSGRATEVAVMLTAVPGSTESGAR